MNVLGIIPARGGSKGIPNKNLREINGKPLIFYTIERAIESELISHLILSSDSPSILNLCSQFKDLYLDKRPEALATDESNVSHTISYLIEKAEQENGIKYDYILLLQPTSPIRIPGEIDKALTELSNRKEFDSLISVCEMKDIHPARMYNIDSDQKMIALIPELETVRRQDLDAVYFRDGTFYITKRDVFMKEQKLMNHPVYAFERDSKYLLNLDEPRDLLIAGPLLKQYYI